MNHTKNCALCIFFILLPSSFILTGCNVIGAAARVLPATTIRPRYTGLAGQSIGVMAWADRGVLLHRGGHYLIAKAARDVIVAAGAVGSPHLLQVSGIGDPAHLKPLIESLLAD